MAAENTTRIFGSTRRRVAGIGQGTWKIESSAAADAIAALRRGLDLGLTHIDTAEMYGSGASEKIIGKAIEGRRDEVFLVSKVLPNHASKNGTLKASDIAHVTENAGAYGVELSDSDIAKIDAAFPRGKAPRGLPMI